MNSRKLIVALALAAVVAAGGYGLYRVGLQEGITASAQMPNVAVTAKTSAVALNAGDIDPATGKKVLYWQDPMAPGQKFDKPGKAPLRPMPEVSIRRRAKRFCIGRTRWRQDSDSKNRASRRSWICSSFPCTPMSPARTRERSLSARAFNRTSACARQRYSKAR